MSDKYVAKLVSQAFGVGSSVVDSAMSGNALVAKFVSGEGPSKLLFYYQPQTSSVPTVFVTSGEMEPLTGRCAYFIRLVDGKPVDVANVDTVLNFVTHRGGSQTVDTLKYLTSDLFQPCIKANMFGFAKLMSEEDKGSLVKSNDMLCTKLDTALENLAAAVNLPIVEARDLVGAADAPGCTRQQWQP